MSSAASPALGEVEASLSALVRSGDAAALRLLAHPGAGLSRALGALLEKEVSLEALEARLAELRQAILDAQEEAERLRYRAQVVEVQTTLRLPAGTPATPAGRSDRPGRRRGQSRLEREAAELLQKAAEREGERRRLEEEQALLTAVITAMMAGPGLTSVV